jgi:hypothetical protein
MHGKFAGVVAGSSEKGAILREGTMKLRILGNSMRLRVTRSELQRLQAGETIEECVRFSMAPGASLTYALAVAPGEAAVGVQYSPQRVAIVLNGSQLQAWCQEDQVGIYTSVENGSPEGLKLVIEKDFACLDRSHPTNADAFPNPNAGGVC